MKEVIGIIGIIVLIVSVLVFAMAIAAAVRHQQCSARWPDRLHQWGVFSGCLVEHQGRMIPEDRVWFERNQ